MKNAKNAAGKAAKSLLTGIQKQELDKTILDHQKGKLKYYSFNEIKKYLEDKKIK